MPGETGQKATLGQDVDVWLAIGGLGQHTDAALVALLDDCERDRLDRFRHAGARRDFLVARALLRTVLSRYTAVPPEAWRFALGPWGRPEISAPEAHAPGAADGLRFNLSHTPGLVACAVAQHVDVGVDVEHTERRTQPSRIAHRYFAKPEVDALRALSPVQQRGRFFDLWTLKESYIKARGMGLAIPLGKFWFGLDSPGAITFDTAPELEDDPAGWQFALAEPTPHHRLATAVRCAPGIRRAIRYVSLPRLDAPRGIPLVARAVSGKAASQMANRS